MGENMSCTEIKFHTGTEEYPFKFDKCKLLCASAANIYGADVNFLDVSLGFCFRVVHANDADLFAESALVALVTAGDRLADAVVLVGGGDVRAYTSHAKAPPSEPLLYAAAAYGEYIRTGKRDVSFCDRYRCEVDSSSVTVYKI